MGAKKQGEKNHLKLTNFYYSSEKRRLKIINDVTAYHNYLLQV